MKKQLLVGLILFSSFLSLDAQIYTPDSIIQGSSGNNNIGIGVLPIEKLTVEGNFQFGGYGSSLSDFYIKTFDGRSAINNGNGRNLILSAGSSDNRAGKTGGNLYLRPGIPTAPATTFGNILLADEGGMVGIGTTNTTEKLTVEGHLKFGGYGSSLSNFYIKTYDGSSAINNGNGRNLVLTAGSSDNATGKTGGNLYLRPGEPTTPATIFGNVILADEGGMVGIGTTNPNNKLHLYTSNGPIAMTLQTGSSYVYLGNDGDNIVLASDAGSTGFKLLVNRAAPDNSMIINSAGNVGIGNSAPNYKFEVSGNIKLSKELIWPLEQKNFSALPREGVIPMSIRLWDNYQGGGPSSYGSLLEIYGREGHMVSQLYFGGWDNSRIRYREAFYAQNQWNEWCYLLDSKNDVESSGNLHITGSGSHYISSGNIGIGTTNPNNKLHLYSNGGPVAMTLQTGSSYAYLCNDGDNIILASDIGSTGFKLLVNRTAPDNSMIINSAGNVGIGITTPGDYRLNVWGKIRAHEVVVNTTGADFVFEPDYKLPKLAEIEKYIKKNKRLPNLPPASEMKEKGMNVSEMQTKLLQKIEELTLYVIEQDKRIELLENENYKLKHK